MRRSDNELHDFCAKLSLLPALEDGAATEHSRAFLQEILATHAHRRLSQIDAINEMPLYPTEQVAA